MTTDTPVNRSLFAIGRDLQALDELLADHTEGRRIDPEALDALNAWMDQLDTERAAKLDRVHAYLADLEMRRQAADKQAGEWGVRADSFQRRIDTVKDMVRDYLQRCGQKRVESAAGIRFTLAANGGKRPVQITDPAAVPPPMLVVTARPDLDAIRGALEDGLTLPFATLGERGTHLRIS